LTLSDNSSSLTPHERREGERRQETIECASIIHGGSADNQKPTMDGLWCTCTKSVSVKGLVEYIEATPKIIDKAVPLVIKKKVKRFESSDENAARSLKVLYGGGLISKMKYKDIRSASSLLSNANKNNKRTVEVMPGVPIPKILPYGKLMKYINELDIGTLHDVSMFCNDEDDRVEGKFRDIEQLLLKMAKLYLYVDSTFYSTDNPLLKWFNNDKGLFKVAIGADGAPFGKNSEATAWLVSFLNVGGRVASPNDNFLVCGANCKEDHEVMVRYAKDLVVKINAIESKTYAIDGINVRFALELLPSDMKWLAFYSGELNNAAYYFSSFGNVNESDKGTVGGSLGTDPGDTWRP